MSTITNKFTKEQLQQIEAAAKEVMWPVVWSEKKAREHFSEKITPKVVLKLARIALASLEAEPVAYIFKHPAGRLFWSLTDESNKGQSDVMPVYTTQPAPVSVPDDVMAAMQKVARIRLDLNDFDGDKRGILDCLSDAEEALIEVVNRRAAMLQGAEPVTTAYKLPANTPCNDAPEHIWLQTAGVWPENGEFGELTWCSDNQHHDDTLYVRADVVSGNSPVIPDGWKLVPVEPTPEMQSAAAGAIRFDTTPINKLWTGNSVYKAMLAAAPQQEA
jgi:hypothetical protein